MRLHGSCGEFCQHRVRFSQRFDVRLAATKPGFLWSTLAKSLDGQTVVNVEAIADPGDVEHSDPAFAEKFERLRSLCASEFPLYGAEAPILPIRA